LPVLLIVFGLSFLNAIDLAAIDAFIEAGKGDVD
jgi:hypothetical protein